ncbi:MAG: thioesterase family protein, partial [Planctomycetota bacterium]|nr:thioesterase family protein [Planctomycetota bacterium]
DFPPLPEDSDLPFGCVLRTRWSDEDRQGVLNNAIYLTLFEEARLQYFLDLGLMPEASFPFLLAQSQLRFVSPGQGGVEVRVQMGTTHLGNSSFEQCYRVSGTDGRVWCEGRALLVCYDPETGKSRPMEERFRSVLQSSAVK